MSLNPTKNTELKKAFCAIQIVCGLSISKFLNPNSFTKVLNLTQSIPIITEHFPQNFFEKKHDLENISVVTGSN